MECVTDTSTRINTDKLGAGQGEGSVRYDPDLDQNLQNDPFRGIWILFPQQNSCFSSTSKECSDSSDSESWSSVSSINRLFVQKFFGLVVLCVVVDLDPFLSKSVTFTESKVCFWGIRKKKKPLYRLQSASPTWTNRPTPAALWGLGSVSGSSVFSSVTLRWWGASSPEGTGSSAIRQFKRGTSA